MTLLHSIVSYFHLLPSLINYMGLMLDYEPTDM